jgi:hypothetical protein
LVCDTVVKGKEKKGKDSEREETLIVITLDSMHV